MPDDSASRLAVLARTGRRVVEALLRVREDSTLVPAWGRHPETFRVARMRSPLAEILCMLVLVLPGRLLALAVFMLAGAPQLMVDALSVTITPLAAYLAYVFSRRGTTWYVVPSELGEACRHHVRAHFRGNPESFRVYARKAPGTFFRKFEDTP